MAGKRRRREVDSVNHPSHYNFGKYEVIDVIEDWDLGFNLGNTIKYIARAGRKGDKLTDLEKAKWYLEREIEHCGPQEPMIEKELLADDIERLIQKHSKELYAKLKQRWNEERKEA
jgi:hypothetical protein